MDTRLQQLANVLVEIVAREMSEIKTPQPTTKQPSGMKGRDDEKQAPEDTS